MSEKEAIDKAIKAGRASVRIGDSLLPITGYREVRYCTDESGNEFMIGEEDEIIIHQPKKKL